MTGLSQKRIFVSKSIISYDKHHHVLYCEITDQIRVTAIHFVLRKYKLSQNTDKMYPLTGEVSLSAEILSPLTDLCSAQGPF